MTIQMAYKECERLFCEIDWEDQESVRRYNEAVKRLEEMRKEERRRNANG